MQTIQPDPAAHDSQTENQEPDRTGLAPTPAGEVVVTKNAAGLIVAVTRQDEEGRILSVISESAPSPEAAGGPNDHHGNGLIPSPATNGQLQELRRTIERLTRERDEADRRAGAAERELASARETLACHSRSRERMKDEAGYDRNVSFDIVWSDLMTELARLRPSQPTTSATAVA